MTRSCSPSAPGASRGRPDNSAPFPTETEVLNVMRKLLNALLRLALVAVGLVFAGLLLAAGLVFTVVLVLWSLLRGRRPQVRRFRVDPRSPFAGMRPGPAAPQGDVVDIEAREVPEAPSRLERDRS